MPYLDYAASNPLDPRVIETMTGILGAPGNPSSVHEAGRRARMEIDAARKDVAALLGVVAKEVIFTSGATEANVTGILGLYRAAVEGRGDGPFRVLTSPIEHASVRSTLERLSKEHGAFIDTLPVDADGIVAAEDVRSAITDDTALIVVMWANNVFGTIQPIAHIGDAVKSVRAARGKNGLPLVFFSDATQAVRTEDVRPRDAGLDGCAISAHKMYGPKGAGALWLKEGTAFIPTMVGGGQESGRRSGTENTVAIAGFGEAARVLREERDVDRAHATALRSRLLAALRTELPSVMPFGDPERSVPGIAYLLTGRVDGDALAVMLDAAGIAVSSGSACDAGKRGSAAAIATIRGGGVNGMRISFGRGSTASDVDAAVAALKDALRRT